MAWPLSPCLCRRVVVLPKAIRQNRNVTSLPQIPGIILTNNEIPRDRLISQVRKWAASSVALQSGGFDLLQLAESADGKVAPRAICGLLRTQLLLADCNKPVRALVVLFHRARDYLTGDFWADQAWRLCDIIADEYLGEQGGVHLMLHHRPPALALGLEIGDHRLLGEFGWLHVRGSLWGGPKLLPGFDLEVAEDSTSTHSWTRISGHDRFHQLVSEGECNDPSTPSSQISKTPGQMRCGHYVLRDTSSGAVACGLQVLGALPLRLVCSGAWAAEGHERELTVLVEMVRQRAQRQLCSILADSRDPHWQRLCSIGQSVGWWQAMRPANIAITGVPVGLQAQEQTSLAQAPFLPSWEFLPFHAGRLMFL